MADEQVGYDVSAFGEVYIYKNKGRNDKYKTGVWVNIIWEGSPATDEPWDDSYANADYGLNTNYTDLLRTSWTEMMANYRALAPNVLLIQRESRTKHKVRSFNRAEWCDNTQSVLVTLTWTDGTQSTGPWSDEFDTNEYTKLKSYKPMKLKIRAIEARHVPVRSSSVNTNPDSTDQNDGSEDYGNRLIVFDLEWHDTLMGPISQIACTSMDGSYSYNRFIKYRTLHRVWKRAITSGVVDLSKWDDDNVAYSLYEALMEIFTAIPARSVMIYHGTTDRASLIWGIEMQIKVDAQRIEIRELIDRKEIRFASSFAWIREQHQFLSTNAHLFGNANSKRVGTVEFLYRKLFVDRSTSTRETRQNAIEQFKPIAQSLQNLSDHTRVRMEEIVGIKREPNTKVNEMHVVFHEAGTDATALKLIMMVLAFSSHAFQSHALDMEDFSTSTRKWTLVCAVARALSRYGLRDHGLYGYEFIASQSLSAFMWSFFDIDTNNVEGLNCNVREKAKYAKLRLAKRSDNLRHVDAWGVKCIAQRLGMFADKRKKASAALDEDPYNDTAWADEDEHHPESELAACQDLRERIHQQRKVWVDAYDSPSWVISPSPQEPGVFKLHCKHCQFVKIDSKDPTPALKLNAQGITSALKNGETRNVRYRFCKACKKYEDDLDFNAVVDDDVKLNGDDENKNSYDDDTTTVIDDDDDGDTQPIPTSAPIRLRPLPRSMNDSIMWVNMLMSVDIQRPRRVALPRSCNNFNEFALMLMLAES